MPSTAPARPRFGAFITMTVGILLFFGLVSRIHEIPGVGYRPRQKESDRDRQRRELEESRDRAFVVFGQSTTADEAEESGAETEMTPREDVTPTVPHNPDPGPEPRNYQPAPQPEPVQPEPRPKPQPEPRPRRRYHVIQSGETLWKLAEKYYGQGHLHTRILSANPGVSPSQLSVGQSLLIPELNTERLSLTNTGHSSSNP